VSPNSATLTNVTEEIKAELGDSIEELIENRGTLILRVAAEKRADALATLKAIGFTFYSWCGGVDWPDEDRMELLDQVANLSNTVRVTLKCSMPRSAPRVPTAITVYVGADWHEREAWELFGIHFTGHPKLRRLLLPDWQEGYPMRKDYELRARIEKPWPGDFFSG
jgi:NADH-quinone oxidoreductase subunit C